MNVNLSGEERYILVDRLCERLVSSWREGKPIRIEALLEDVPESLRDAVIEDLIAEECAQRHKVGERPQFSDYESRFKNHLTAALQGFRHFDPQVTALKELAEALQQEPMSPEVAGEQSAEADTDDSRLAQTDQQQADANLSVEKKEKRGDVPRWIGRYEILRVLGEGGFGRVYLAEDTQLHRQVALKVPSAKYFEKGQSVEKFLEEARTAARLDHKGLVRVHDVQQEHGRPYIIQQYIEGSNLDRWMKTAGASYEQIVRILIEIVEAVGFLHQKRLIHRDLKPGNILVDTEGHAHVADFGLAVHESSQWERAGEVAGTWRYMSPEQVRGLTHKLEGRSDLWSVGVILYEMVVGENPFPAKNVSDLRDQILTLEPRHPKQLVPQVPKELERICMKCLEKRRRNRYASAAELLDDLQQLLATLVAGEDRLTTLPNSASKTVATVDSASGKPDSSGTQPVRVVPKGLRSFDEHDADFFLELLPGARDRGGLPESIRFWKTRIEEHDPDKTFSVGLIYGPSGCGKSSLVKAGLLPRLDSRIVSVYVEATAEDTEVRLLKGLKKRLTHIPEVKSLPETFQRLRQRGIGGGRKLLMVFDQFEQWLHTHGGEETSQLVEALRHCDGGNMQCIVLVRDDYLMPCQRFLDQLETVLNGSENFTVVDLFNLRHAAKVMRLFGQSFATLPPLAQEESPEQTRFVEQAVTALADDKKRVICVRLALFADMIKDKPWVPATLEQVGGVEGVGVTFLEETLSAAAANPRHRLHTKAARAVLKALLPETGSDIKGGMRSYEQLLAESGYVHRPRDFAALIQILDGELRLVTPTDPEGSLRDEERSVKEEAVSKSGPESTSTVDNFQPSSLSLHSSRYYQLTHDYLVPSLREWLTRKQKETSRGRAELRLAERAALWTAKEENRHLPAWWEYLNIALLVPARNWTAPQRRMMKAATGHYAMLASCGLVVLIVAGFALQRFLYDQQLAAVRVRVDSLQNNMGAGIPLALENLEPLSRTMVLTELNSRYRAEDQKKKLPVAYGLARFDKADIKYLVDAVGAARAEEADNIVVALNREKTSELACQELKTAAAIATDNQRWELKTRLATIALHLGDTSIAAQMLQAEPTRSGAKPPPDWHDSPLPPDWEAAPQRVTASIAAAHGMLAERFAFCLDMPWDEFLVTSEALRPCRYRATRVRPFEHNSQRRVAAIWTRDARRWHLDPEMSVEQLPSTDQPAERDGMLPEDLAAYPTSSGGLSYLLLWCERGAEGEQRRLAADLKENELRKSATAMSQAKFSAQKTLQVALGGDGARRYAGIWSNQGTATAIAQNVESKQLVDQSLQDISLAPLGKPTDPLVAMQEQLDEIARTLTDQQQAPATRLRRAKALYYLDQPEPSLAELNNLPTETSTTSQTSMPPDVWQFRALNLAKLGKEEESQAAYQQFVKLCNDSQIRMGFARYTEIIVNGWLGHREKAERQLDAMAAATEQSPDVLYNAACAAAQLARVAASSDDGGAARLGKRALQLLRLATAGGYSNITHIQSDGDLAPLHKDADFRVLLIELWKNRRYATLVLRESAFDVNIAADLELQQQLERAVELVGQGYRPFTVAANVGGGKAQVLSAIVWQRPRPPETKWDPVQRTMFIEYFPKWSGEVGKLVNVVRDAKVGSLRSGMCLAIGSQTDATSETKEAWRDVFLDFYRQQPDSGTHSAAGWALRNWGLKCPEIPLTGPGQETKDWQRTKSGLTMLRIPAGEFTQREESRNTQGESRFVKVSEFWLADREITVGLFTQFTEDKDYPIDQKPPKRDRVNENVSPTVDHPAQMVSWYDAVLFCNWLNWKEGLPLSYRKTGAKYKMRDLLGKEKEYDVWEPVPDGWGYRLPTEAEWEYACRASTTTDFAFGDNAKLMSNYGVILSSSAERVGSKLCNELGLFDMHGNVWEWCGDWYGSYGAKTSVDPQGPSTGSNRVFRGGSWYNSAASCRTANRTWDLPVYRNFNLGFRAALAAAGKGSRREGVQGVSPGRSRF